MLKELIENKEIARIERETKRREFLISPGVYLNVFSISYPNDLKEKFRLRLSLMPGIQYTYIWRFDTTKYVAYTKDFMTGEERNAGRVNIPFTGSDEDDRIEICFKIQGNIIIIDLYMNNCIAPRPSGLFRYNPVHTLFVGIGITF
jgi:hypothetical protein